MHRARSCGQLAIEEVSWRLELTLATCGYIILQSCTIIIGGAGAAPSSRTRPSKNMRDLTLQFTRGSDVSTVERFGL